jgi:hypothetical protein
MRCIKEKCKYAKGHLFYRSYLTCVLDGLSFSKDRERRCRIDKHIQDLNDRIIELEKYRGFIANNSKNGNPTVG